MNGKKINGKYEIIQPLSESHQYRVFEAKELETGTSVALKILKEEMSSNAERMRIFSEEIRSFAAISHPNIVHVLDVDIIDECPYVVTEKIDGMDLRTWLGKDVIPFADVVRTIQQIAAVLQYAAHQKINNRSVKLSNIFRTNDGKIRILSFTHPRLKLVGARKTDEQAGIHSDLFFLGTTFYELLTGESPIRKRGGINEYWGERLMQALRIRHPQLAPGLIEQVREFIDKTFTRNIRTRYANHEAFLVALTNLMFTARSSVRAEDKRLKLANASEVVDAINGKLAVGAGHTGTGECCATFQALSSGNICVSEPGVKGNNEKSGGISRKLTRLMRTSMNEENSDAVNEEDNQPDTVFKSSIWRVSDEHHWLRNPIILMGSLLTFMVLLILFW